MSEVPERVVQLAEALYDTLMLHTEGMDIREVHVALSTFVSQVIMDGERVLEQEGQYKLATRLKPEFIALLTGP